MEETELYEKGLAKHTEIFGAGVEEWRKQFREINPDAVEYLMKYCFGAYYCRPGVELKIRELCTVSALAVLGRWPQLKSHICGALRVGATKTEVTEILLQMQNYAGWPVALTSLEVANEAFLNFDEEQKS
ncbi:MAG: carboxymuconolactone decarboxylase family protein [Chloroflexi bacterium]|nr:carboxymuconolactone decarboxylase family protein [Chloroflexota bacterium]